MCWGRSAHPAPLSPEVTGPGLGRGARATGSPRGQGPLQLGSRFQEQESRTSGPTSCPGTAAPTTPACRAKRKQGRGGGSQPAVSWGLCPDPRPRTDRGQGHRLRGPSHVHSGPHAGPPQPRPALQGEERTAEQDPVLRPHGPAGPASCPPPSTARPAACVRPSVHSSGDSQTHRLTASPSRPRPPPWPSACGNHPTRPVTVTAWPALG